MQGQTQTLERSISARTRRRRRTALSFCTNSLTLTALTCPNSNDPPPLPHQVLVGQKRVGRSSPGRSFGFSFLPPFVDEVLHHVRAAATNVLGEAVKSARAVPPTLVRWAPSCFRHHPDTSNPFKVRPVVRHERQVQVAGGGGHPGVLRGNRNPGGPAFRGHLGPTPGIRRVRNRRPGTARSGVALNVGVCAHPSALAPPRRKARPPS